MGKIEFDLTKLKQLADIDTVRAIKNFESYEDYFLALDNFMRESKYCLRSYIPVLIIDDEDERKGFRADIKKMRVLLMSLGIMYPLPTLTELEYEAQTDDENSLSIWLKKYHTEIDAIIEKLELSRKITADQAQKNAGDKEKEKPIILAVDDKPEILTTIVNMLEEQFKVMASSNGNAVLKLIEKHPPELFLLDIEMPQMNGFELAKLIREHKKFEKTPILFLTSLRSKDAVMNAIKTGGSGYILKPVAKDVLISKVLQHLGATK